MRLRTTREESDSANAELHAANEELQSINEEYRSTSEELETSKEELQSINEELQTVNSELKLKLEVVSRQQRSSEPHGSDGFWNFVSRFESSRQTFHSTSNRTLQHHAE